MKYTFVQGDTKTVDGHLLTRIQRLSDGTSGGFIETHDNLSQDGTSWVHGDSVVYDHAVIRDDAQVYGAAHDRARVEGRAVVQGAVFGDAMIRDDAQVFGEVFEQAIVEGRARIYGVARGSAHISGDQVVYGMAS